ISFLTCRRRRLQTKSVLVASVTSAVSSKNSRTSRVRDPKILRSTSLNSRKCVLNYEDSKKAKTMKTKSNQRRKDEPKKANSSYRSCPDSDHFASLEPGQTSVTITDRPNSSGDMARYQDLGRLYNCSGHIVISGYPDLQPRRHLHRLWGPAWWGSRSGNRIRCLAARGRQ